MQSFYGGNADYIERCRLSVDPENGAISSLAAGLFQRYDRVLPGPLTGNVLDESKMSQDRRRQQYMMMTGKIRRRYSVTPSRFLSHLPPAHLDTDIAKPRSATTRTVA